MPCDSDKKDWVLATNYLSQYDLSYTVLNYFCVCDGINTRKKETFEISPSANEQTLALVFIFIGHVQDGNHIGPSR